MLPKTALELRDTNARPMTNDYAPILVGSGVPLHSLSIEAGENLALDGGEPASLLSWGQSLAGV